MVIKRNLPIPTADEVQKTAADRIERSSMTHEERWESWLSCSFRGSFRSASMAARSLPGWL